MNDWEYEIRDSHDVSCHIAYGASAVWPYLALEKVRQIALENENLDITVEQAQENYRSSLNKGLLKIMSKMGICTISSYNILSDTLTVVISLPAISVARYCNSSVLQPSNFFILLPSRCCIICGCMAWQPRIGTQHR